MKIEIREIKEFNIIAPLVEEVQNLHANIFPSVYKPFEYQGIKKEMEAMLSNELCKVFLAKTENITVGYVMILIKKIPENAFHYSMQIIHIDQIVVAEAYKRVGVGAMLLNKVEEFSKEMKVNRIELDHLNNNSIAKTFFHSKGFLPYRSKLIKHLI
jgi:ribosomal protein S18 acetylase RimI-like enzyme